MSKVTIPLKEYEKLSQVKKLFDNGAKFVSYSIAGENLYYNEIVELSKEEVINTIKQDFEGQLEELHSQIGFGFEFREKYRIASRWASFYAIAFFITAAFLIAILLLLF